MALDACACNPRSGQDRRSADPPPVSRQAKERSRSQRPAICAPSKERAQSNERHQTRKAVRWGGFEDNSGVTDVELTAIVHSSRGALRLSASRTRKNFSASMANNLAGDCVSIVGAGSETFNHLFAIRTTRFRWIRINSLETRSVLVPCVSFGLDSKAVCNPR